MLRPGDRAPDFELASPDGERVRLSALLSTRPVVLYFYPADFTPVCTAQACMIRDARQGLDSAGYHVIGISPQDADSHRRFDERHTLGFLLLSDPDRIAARSYQVAAPFGFVRRVTFVIGQDGIILDRTSADLRLGPHASLVDRLMSDRGDEPDRT